MMAAAGLSCGVQFGGVPKIDSRALVVDNHDRSQVPTMVNLSHGPAAVRLAISGWAPACSAVTYRPLAAARS